MAGPRSAALTVELRLGAFGNFCNVHGALLGVSGFGLGGRVILDRYGGPVRFSEFRGTW